MNHWGEHVIILKRRLNGSVKIKLAIIGTNSERNPIREILIVLRYLKWAFLYAFRVYSCQPYG